VLQALKYEKSVQKSVEEKSLESDIINAGTQINFPLTIAYSLKVNFPQCSTKYSYSDE
jgi:hypothetical protein